MWTFLGFFLGIMLIVGVFLHRMYILNKYGAEEVVQPVVEEETFEEEQKKVSKSVATEIETLCARGEAFLKNGKDEEAIKCFVQALSLDGFHKETQHRLAMLYLKKEMYSAAAALFKQLGDTTSDPVHYSHLGLALYQQSDFEGAMKAYQKAVDLDGSRPQRFANLAHVYKAIGRLQHAIIAMNKAVEVDGENIDLLVSLGQLQFEKANYVEAERVCRGVLGLEPENVEAKALLRELKKISDN